MYRPLSRFLQLFGYDSNAPLNPLLLISIINKYADRRLEPVVRYQDIFEANCQILAQFLRADASNIVDLAQTTFNFVAKRSKSPDETIIKVLRSYGFDIHDYKRLLLGGVLFNLIISSFQGTFKTDFDILLRTYRDPKTQHQIQQNLKIGLHFINKLGCVLVQPDDFEDARVLPFALYQLGYIEPLLKGFAEFKGSRPEFADTRENLANSVTQIAPNDNNCVFLSNLVSWRGKFQILFNIVISNEQNCVEISRNEILEVYRLSNSVILIAKDMFYKFDARTIKIGFTNEEECAEQAQSIVEWIQYNEGADS